MDIYNDQWPYTRMTQPRETGVDRLNALYALSAQMETLSKKLDVLAAQRIQKIAVICDNCGGNHSSHHCTINCESTWYGGNFGDYPNSYNYSNDYYQGWGNYQDSSWSYNQQDQFYAPSPTYASEFSCPPPLPQEENSSLVEFMSKMIANQEETMRNWEISSQNLNNHMEQLINASSNGLQYMDSETETNNSRLEEVCSKFMASSEEIIKYQEMSTRNLENQLEQCFNTVNNCPHGDLLSELVPKTDGTPEPIVKNSDMGEPIEEKPKLQPDVPFDVDVMGEETSEELEMMVEEDPDLSSSAHEQILIMPHLHSSAKLKDLDSFAVPCPIGSHVLGEALCDIRAGMNLEPWCDEEKVHEMKDEDPFVFEKLQSSIPFTDTMKQTPSYSRVTNEIVHTSDKLGELKTMALATTKPSDVSPLLMDEADGESFFLPLVEAKFGGRQSCKNAMHYKEITTRRHDMVIFAIEPD